VYRGEVLHHVHVPDVYQEAATTSASEDTLMLVRVLIADPDEYLLDHYRDYLEQHGFEVATATTGVECVERLRECAPDVLVLEPSIPWGWGDGVLAMMHEEPDIPLVPVIVLTYGRDRSVLYRLAPFKIDDYQAKPLRANRLAQRIRSLVACHRNANTAVSAGAKP
jgi:two-component system phosphate regulon response regulator OmpR